LENNITSHRLGATETGFLDPQRNENPDVWSSVDADDDRTLKDPRSVSGDEAVKQNEML
jgi:hypothetical protein